MCILSRFRHVQLCATLCTVAHQAPLSMGFSRQEDWNGLPFPPPGDLPNTGIKPVSPALRADSILLNNWGSSPKYYTLFLFYYYYFSHAAYRILVPQPEIKPWPLHRKHHILTAGLPGRSQHTCFKWSWPLSSRFLFPCQISKPKTRICKVCVINGLLLGYLKWKSEEEYPDPLGGTLF